VGAKRVALLGVLGIRTVEDLLYHIPSRYEDRRFITKIASLTPGESAVVRGTVKNFVSRSTRKRNVFLASFSVLDDSAAISATLFGGPRSFDSILDGARIFLYGTPSLSEKNFLEFKNPEFLVRDDESEKRWLRLLPVYPTTGGMRREVLANIIRDCVASPALEIDDPLPDDIVRKYSFPTLKEAFRGIHAPSSPREASSARGRLAYQEFFVNLANIARHEKKRKKLKAHVLSSGEEMESRFVSGLPFKLTASQEEAIADIAADTGRDVPMDRLVIGDVGSGKTAVAAAAIGRCVGAGRQAAVLVPTTILAEQFFSFCERHFAPLGIRTAKISGDMPKALRDELLWRLRDNDVDVLIGAHAMLGDDVAFKSLGLLVIDEQQRFGVAQRDKIAFANRGVHILMTSATPIPRTLRMAIYGDIACTEMASRPDKGRVITRVMSDNHIDELYQFLSGRIARDGVRCYWVCPTVGDGGSDDGSSVVSRVRDIKRNMRGMNIESMTGRMTPREKTDAMQRFAGAPGILVATTVIGVGVDVRGADIIIIESASAYGLSTLHQMRGRVGRGAVNGICVLLDSARSIKDNPRLGVLLKCDDGFKIAEEDLKLRGAGEYLGTRQHGDENFRVADIARDAKLFEAARNDAADFF
jgi:ATP-dependent DNA helicase RecG